MFGFESWCLGSNPGVWARILVRSIFCSFFMCVPVCLCACVCVTRFGGSNPGEVNFFSLHHLFFLPGSAIVLKNVVCVVVLTFIRGMLFLACMAVIHLYRPLLRNRRAFSQ